MHGVARRADDAKPGHIVRALRWKHDRLYNRGHQTIPSIESKPFGVGKVEWLTFGEDGGIASEDTL